MGTNVNQMTIAPIRNLPKQKNKSNCQSLIEALFFFNSPQAIYIKDCLSV